VCADGCTSTRRCAVRQVCNEREASGGSHARMRHAEGAMHHRYRSTHGPGAGHITSAQWSLQGENICLQSQLASAPARADCRTWGQLAATEQRCNGWRCTVPQCLLSRLFLPLVQTGLARWVYGGCMGESQWAEQESMLYPRSIPFVRGSIVHLHYHVTSKHAAYRS
jgi:hypothetical protein